MNDHVPTDPSCAHTPGPWAVGRTGKPATLAIFHEMTTARELIGRFADHTVSYADAQLMAAAPDLLAIAHRMLAAWEGSREAIELDDIRAVIAKAENRL